MFGWQTRKERIAKGAKISLKKKLEGIRMMNELADGVLTRHQKVLRQRLRGAC